MITSPVLSGARPGIRRRLLIVAAALSIFLFAFGLRFFTFFLQHWQGDQSQYVSLAMKYDALGLEGLNLNQVELKRIIFVPYPDWTFMYPVLSDKPTKGDLFKAYEMSGLMYNDMPLYHKSPFFAVTLAASHHLFAGSGQPFMVLYTVPDFVLHRIEYNKYFFLSQFWAVIVPLASSLLVVWLTFFMALRIFNARIALYAMFLMAIHPVDIVTSYKVLSDSFVAAFVTMALFLFYLSYERKSLFLTFISGLVAGLAVLAKQSAIMILFTAALYLIFAEQKKWFCPRAWISIFKNQYFFWFVAAALFISFHWFAKVYQVYGNPFFQPDPGRLIKEDLSGWFQLVSHRPQAFMLFLINIPLFCPPYIFGHWTFTQFCKVFVLKTLDEQKRRALLFFWFWILPFVLFFTFRIESREERYLLPVYPALAILSGWALSAFQEKISSKISRLWPGRLLVGVFLLLTVAWSVPMALETVFRERFLILEPLRLVKIFYHSGYRILWAGL